MTNPELQTIDVHELKSRLDSNPSLCLIDVRETHEWQTLHIPDAVLIPKDEIESKIASVATDYDQPVYLHCKSGMRSIFAGNLLIEMGYKHVYSVSGGIMGWAQAGYPVVG